MRQVLNFFIVGLVLWAASQVFPDIVQIDGVWALVIAVILMWLIEFVIAVLSTIIIELSACADNIVGMIIGLIILLFANVIGLSILSSILDGFMVVGFWPKVLLAIAFLFLRVGSSSSSKDS